MGFLSEFFGFDGRIDRLGYLWRSLVAGASIGGAGAAAFLGLLFVAQPQGLTGVDVWSERLLTGFALLALWAGLALASRRLRDMGLEPVYVVPLFVALWVVDQALIAPLSRIQPESFGVLEDGWEALRWFVAVPLLFWPGRAAAASPPAAKASFEPAAPTQQLNWRQGG
jgi:uncharacterized membrane protein YhaH (DUF805 family)